jgi:hypothetical protein
MRRSSGLEAGEGLAALVDEEVGERPGRGVQGPELVAAAPDVPPVPGEERLQAGAPGGADPGRLETHQGGGPSGQRRHRLQVAGQARSQPARLAQPGEVGELQRHLAGHAPRRHLPTGGVEHQPRLIRIGDDPARRITPGE